MFKHLSVSLDDISVNEPLNKIPCSETNGESESIDELEETSKNELSMFQIEHDENIENDRELLVDSKSNDAAQKDVLCSILKDIDDAKDDQNTEERSEDKSTINQNPENVEVEDNNQSTLNEETEQIDTDNKDNKNQASVLSADQSSSSSTQVQIREKCKYGSQCYRLNVEHKAKFSHPGDTDYDDPDNKPECPYGILCYRKNPQHRLNYKHTRTKHKRTQNPPVRTVLDELSDFEDSIEESVDESDEYDGSFIDDDDLDDEFDSDLEFDDLDDENESDQDSDDDVQKKKKKKRKINNDTKEKKKKKT